MEIRFTSSKQVRTSADAELPLPVVRAPDLSGRVLGARYSLRRRIGGGSLGTVYEARDMTLGTAVAVKVLHPDYSGDEDFRRRFHQEARLGARLRHEHSVAVTDLGQSDDGLLYSVMEYLEGESLDGLLSSRPGPLPWRRVVTIAVQVCAALQAAHDRGVIHRDIKPGNCFLVRREGHRGQAGQETEDAPPFTFVKVLDLGLARLMPATGRPTPPGRLGAPEYLAPEQIQGFTCDHRVDIYALGVMMYKLLTRRLPFTGDNPAAIMRMHIEAVPTPPRRLAPSADIPASLEAVVLRALSKDRGDRYPSAHMMANAIRAAAADAEAEAIAIDEAPDDSPTTLWRTGLGASTTRGTQVSATMILVPAFGHGPDLRRGLIGLVFALVSIVVAVAALWSFERPVQSVPDTPVTAPVIATPLAARDVTAPRSRLPLLAPLGPLPTEARDSRVLLEPGTTGTGTTGTGTTPRALRKPRTPAPSAASSPASSDTTEASAARLASEAPRAPGAPPRRLFEQRADSIAPGVYSCMRQHTPELRSLRVALTVGGPRHTPAALALPEHDSSGLRGCIARLLLRLHFPATEATARYEHVYRP